jgi:hypothetical protein
MQPLELQTRSVFQEAYVLIYEEVQGGVRAPDGAVERYAAGSLSVLNRLPALPGSSNEFERRFGSDLHLNFVFEYHGGEGELQKVVAGERET